MKLYQKYRDIINEIKPITLAWFTTFNLDPELVERYLLSCIAGKEPSQLKTAEDYEALNIELSEKDIRVLYDYRALNLQSPKRTYIDFISVEPSAFFKRKSPSAIFHPKVMFFKGENGAYLITGSANLSISAWSSNRESILIKKINNRQNAKEVIDFFTMLGVKNNTMENWALSLPDDNSNWKFVHNINEASFNLFSHLKKGDLTIWAPYFSKKTAKLLNQIIGLGYKNITLVPNINDHGKISIEEDEVKTLTANSKISMKRTVKRDELQGLYHAKVWLTDETLAVGSWNCSHRATGLNILFPETNIEAGIISNIEGSNTAMQLYNTIEDFDRQENIKGQTEEELDTEWEQVLNDYSISVAIVADWKKFTYSVEPNNIRQNDYFVSLPHKHKEKVRLTDVSGMSFRANYLRVLKDKSFNVYDTNGKLVYSGYLREISKDNRPVYGYNNLADLFESLISDPKGSTGRKICQYHLSVENNNGSQDVGFIEYKDYESLYVMFVSFQKLYEQIDKLKDKAVELDKIGFRLPGSLLNIKLLVKNSIESNVNKNKEDNLIFNFFLILETNRCIISFNKYAEEKIDVIPVNGIQDELKLHKRDKKFLNSLRKEFGYEYA